MDLVMKGETDWNYHVIPMVEEAEAAARADERVSVRNEVLEMCAVDDEKAAEILVNPSESSGATAAKYSWKHIEYMLRESARRHRKLKVVVLDKDESVEPEQVKS